MPGPLGLPDINDPDTQAAIDAATSFVEKELGRAILPQTWTISVEGAWPHGGVMPWRAPIIDIVSITTIRPETVNDVWEAAHWYEMPGARIKAASSAPLSLGDDDWISIEYQAGYADAASVPAQLKQAILIIAAEMLIWNRDVGATPNMWPGNSWQLAQGFMVPRGV